MDGLESRTEGEMTDDHDFPGMCGRLGIAHLEEAVLAVLARNDDSEMHAYSISRKAGIPMPREDGIQYNYITLGVLKKLKAEGRVVRRGAYNCWCLVRSEP